MERDSASRCLAAEVMAGEMIEGPRLCPMFVPLLANINCS